MSLRKSHSFMFHNAEAETRLAQHKKMGILPLVSKYWFKTVKLIQYSKGLEWHGGARRQKNGIKRQQDHHLMYKQEPTV